MLFQIKHLKSQRKFSTSLFPKKIFGFIWQVVIKLEYLFCQKW